MLCLIISCSFASVSFLYVWRNIAAGRSIVTLQKRLQLQQRIGISRIEATGVYALVSHGFCSTCGKIFPNKDFWCDECDRKELMEGWPTGNASHTEYIREDERTLSSMDSTRSSRKIGKGISMLRIVYMGNVWE